MCDVQAVLGYRDNVYGRSDHCRGLSWGKMTFQIENARLKCCNSCQNSGLIDKVIVNCVADL